MTQRELIKVIDRAKQENSIVLDLSNNGLTSLPVEITQLTNLQTLDLDNNGLTSLPAEITQLTKLQTLSLNSNGLTSLPAKIAQLTNLERLSLNSNKLTSLPAEIAQLTKLQTLSLSNNGLTSLPAEITQLTKLQTLSLNSNKLTSLPAEIAQLTNLQTLYLNSNGLTSLPAEIAQLTKLQRLSLNSNKLTSLPAEIAQLTNLQTLYLDSNKLTSLPAEIAQLTKLQRLYLDSNPLISPPREIISQGLEAIQEYLRLQKKPQWVSKLLVVGQGGAGKTNVIKRLKNEDFHEQEETTRGIAIRPLALPHPSLPDVTMQLNTWDFAGQEIEHATHQFFLTNRSLFLIVWNARQGFEVSRMHYWLETIRTRAGKEVPIILVAAHADQRTPDLPLADLQRDYPQIIASFAVSNKTGEGITELRHALTQFAADPKLLPLMGEQWPATWLDAANAIRNTPEKEKKISLRELRERFEQQELTLQETEILTQWLHELGEILHFRDNEDLKDLVILKPQFVTQHIAHVFTSEDVIKREGILTRVEMEGLWPDLDREMQERLLDLMEQFDLSYRTRENPELSLVVARVPFEEPAEYPALWESFRSQEYCREVTMKYELSSIPAGIPTWFIARQHRFSLHLHWRYGVLFGDDPDNTRHIGLLQTFPQTNSLRLTVRGPFPINFFALLRDGLEETLKRFPGLGITRKVPCPGHDGEPCTHEFDYDNLLKRINKKSTIECAITGDDVEIAEMLTGIGWQAQDVILKRLNEIEQAGENRDKQIIEQIDGTAEKVIQSINDKITLAQREFLKEFEELQRLPESYCPNVFILREQKTNKLIQIIVGQKMHLQLLCQEPGDWHPLTEKDKKTQKEKEIGVYEIDDPAQWLRDMAPYIQQLVKYLKWVAPLASPLIGLQFSKEVAESLDTRLKLMEGLVEKLPDIEIESPDGDYAREIGLGKDRRIAEGTQLRALRQLLDLKDKQKYWGGLERVRTPEGHYLWVCEHHAKKYKH